MITLIIMTDGRANYLEESINSLGNLHGEFSQRIIHDDSGDQHYHEWLKWRYGSGFDFHFTSGRSGFSGAYHSAYRLLKQTNTNDYVFFTEDDFVYTRPVEMNDIMEILNRNGHIAQMALRRQPWNEQEMIAGGVVEADPASFIDKTDGTNHWLEHRKFWTTNPSLVPRKIIDDNEWPTDEHSEGVFGINLFKNPATTSAYWGARDSGEWCYHIGNERAGNGY